MNSQAQDAAILQRIDALERQNRWLIRAGLFALLLVVAIVTMGQARPSRAIEAQSFVLRDSSGIKRAELAVVNGSPILRFFDAHGKTRIALDESSGPRIELSGEEDRVRLSLGLIREEPHIFVNDAQGFSAQLGSTPDPVGIRTGAASLILWGKNDKVLWSAP